MGFSTYDNDKGAVNAGVVNDCANEYGGGGNWWNYWCGYMANNINGKYRSNGNARGSIDEFMHWFYFDKKPFMSLKTMTLMFRQAV